MKQTYTVASQIEVEGQLHKPGAELQLTDEQAQYLLEREAIALKPATAAAAHRPVRNAPGTAGGASSAGSEG